MSFCHNGAFGTLVDVNENTPHTSPCAAHGVVYALRQWEVDELIRKEKGYDLKPVRVEPLDESEPFEALAFISSPWHKLPAPLPTTRRYAELCLAGAELKGLPEEYLAWLRTERDAATGSSAVPNRYYNTRSRRVAAIVVGEMLFDRPRTQRHGAQYGGVPRRMIR